MSYIQSETVLFFFAVFDITSHHLLYTKYNFNFELYANDFMPNIDIANNKAKIFRDFLVRNDASLDKPFSVKDELTKYFNPMTPEIEKYFNTYGYCLHPNYMYVETPENYVVIDILRANQFDLIWYTDEQLRRLQDYSIKKGSDIYSKYNFDFNSYSNDWHIWGTKLAVFTDFIVRSIYLNKLIIGAFGYGYPPVVPFNFNKYFIQTPTLNNYLIDYSVLSVYKTTPKNLYSIDWTKYGIINMDLAFLNGNVDALKDHYLTFGQFEQRQIPFVTVKNTMSDAYKGIVTVTSEGLSCSGFLMDGSSSFGSGYVGLYLVTCYHLIDGKSNKNFIMASVTINTPSNNSKNVTRVLQFSVIGYDIYADVCVAYYDPKTTYNTIFNSDIDTNNVSKINLTTDTLIKKGDPLTVIGNLQYDNDLSSLTGYVMDNNYVGNFNLRFVLGMPQSIQLSIPPTPGMSGAPIFMGNYLNNEPLICVGMVNSTCGYNDQFTMGISCFLLHTIVSNIIGNTAVYKSLYSTDIIKYNFTIKDGFPKKWLGISATYYHSTISAKQNPVFMNFPYNGGIVLHDVILGFNTQTNKFIYDVLELSKQNVISLNTPLIGSKMYNKFISSSKCPLVIKSITMLDNVQGTFSKFDMGNYGNQTPYNLITYRMAQIGTTLNDPKYTNKSKRIYESIDIEYYYFNGLGWVLDNDTIGNNTDDWYFDSVDNMGNSFRQHRFDFPIILIPYITYYHDQVITDSPLNYPHTPKNLLVDESNDNLKGSNDPVENSNDILA